MQKNIDNRPEINDEILKQQDKTEIKSSNVLQNRFETKNIMQTKLQNNAVMKKEISVVEEKSKLPPKKNDPYREEF